MIKAQTLKGFRDFLPGEARKRQYVINKLKRVFESFGFEPLETPALEYEEVLLGKYGEEGDKLMYRFTDNGGRKVALRYDQTVPLARVAAQYQNELPMPFKRYQIQPVWRAENTQKGRFREFLQCDIDTVGTTSPLADAEIIACTLMVGKELGFKNPQVWINDRTIFDTLGLTKKEIIILDKLEKIGKESVISELEKAGRSDAEELLEKLQNSQPTDSLNQIFSFLKEQGFEEQKDFFFTPNLARGLEYYTSTIFELKVETYSQSLAGGGRFDNLIGMFLGTDIPAVGISFGFDRLIEVMDGLSLFPADLATTKVLVTVFSPELEQKSIEIANKLRQEGINTELWLDPESKLEKQLKYADQKGIPFVIIIGPEEAETNKVTLKKLADKTQDKLITLDEAIQKLTS